MALTITIDPHPVLEVGVFSAHLPRPLGEIATPDKISAYAAPGVAAPFTTNDAIKSAVRELLRHGGFKPSGRSKPASEYLVAAAAEARFPRINAVVDACNVVSLHSGLPISLVDRGLVDGELAIRIAPAGTSYVFNPSGQTIDVGGLVCLYDAVGPTGTPVKDAQRTKTHDATRDVLAIVWGTRAVPGRTADATRWFRELVLAIDGATVDDVALTQL